MTNEQDQNSPMPQYMERALRNYTANLESIAREFPAASEAVQGFAAVTRKAASLGKLHANREDAPAFGEAFEAMNNAGRENEALGKKLAEAEFQYGSALVLGYMRKELKRASHDFNKAAQKLPQHADLLKEASAAYRGIVPVLYQVENPAYAAAEARMLAAIDKLEDVTAEDKALGAVVEKTQEKMYNALLGMEQRHPGAYQVLDEMKTRAKAKAPKP